MVLILLNQNNIDLIRLVKYCWNSILYILNCIILLLCFISLITVSVFIVKLIKIIFGSWNKVETKQNILDDEKPKLKKNWIKINVAFGINWSKLKLRNLNS